MLHITIRLGFHPFPGRALSSAGFAPRRWVSPASSSAGFASRRWVSQCHPRPALHRAVGSRLPPCWLLRLTARRPQAVSESGNGRVTSTEVSRAGVQCTPVAPACAPVILNSKPYHRDCSGPSSRSSAKIGGAWGGGLDIAPAAAQVVGPTRVLRWFSGIGGPQKTDLLSTGTGTATVRVPSVLSHPMG